MGQVADPLFHCRCLKHPTLQCLLLSVPVLHSNTGTQKKAGFSQCAIKSGWHEKCKPCGQGAGRILRKKLQMARCRPSATKFYLNEGCFFSVPIKYCHMDGVELPQILDINSTSLDSIAIRPHLIRLTQIVLVHLTWPKYLLAKLPCSKSCSEHTWMMHSYSGKDEI